jgi:hypothetical protein
MLLFWLSYESLHLRIKNPTLMPILLVYALVNKRFDHATAFRHEHTFFNQIEERSFISLHHVETFLQIYFSPSRYLNTKFSSMLLSRPSIFSTSALPVRSYHHVVVHSRSQRCSNVDPPSYSSYCNAATFQGPETQDSSTYPLPNTALPQNQSHSGLSKG